MLQIAESIGLTRQSNIQIKATWNIHGYDALDYSKDTTDFICDWVNFQQKGVWANTCYVNVNAHYEITLEVQLISKYKYTHKYVSKYT